MCLFIAIPHENGFLLCSQRDEDLLRPTGEDFAYDKNHKAYYVVDKVGGGTWFAYSSSLQAYSVIVNHNPGKKLSIKPKKSRGEIPFLLLDMIEEKGIENIVFSKTFFNGYGSGKIACGQYKNGYLYHTYAERNAPDGIVSNIRQIKGSLGIAASSLYTNEYCQSIWNDAKELSTHEQVENYLNTFIYSHSASHCIPEEGTGVLSRTTVDYRGGEEIYKHISLRN